MLSVRLDHNLENELHFLAKEKKISKSQIIKDSLVYYFDMLKEQTNKKSSFELGSDLFGKYASGKDNLSTTYKQILKDKINAKNNHR